MEKTALRNEINLLTRCLNYLEEVFFPQQTEVDDAKFEALTEKIGEKITGELTLQKWKAACISQLES
jgi:hypothetical protein